MSMRKLLITAALIAIVPYSATLAQQTRVTTTVTTQSPPVVNPEATAEVAVSEPAVPPVQAVPSSQAQPGATPAADGVIHQWGPQQAITQAAPAPPAAYPPCTKGRTDSCYNPNPNKEADVRADGKIGV
jgi:hypothetical protein